MAIQLEDGSDLLLENGLPLLLESDGVPESLDQWSPDAAGPRTIRQLYHWVWNNLQALSSYLSSSFDIIVEQVKDRNRWMGEWVAGEYQAKDQVEDAGWLMIANKTTDDRAAPTPQSDPIEIYPPPDPTWTVNNDTGHVYSVLEITVPTEGLYSLSNLEVWIQGITADDHYQVFIQDGVSGAFQEVISFDGDVVTQPTWFRVPLAPDFLQPSSVSRIWLHQWDSASSTSQTFPWVRAPNANNTADPGEGNWATRNNSATVRINDLDNNGVDRSAVITDSSLIGSVLRMEQANDANKWVEYIINSVTDNAGWVVYGTSKNSDGPSGEPDVGAICDITFQIPVLSSVEYVTLAGHLIPYPALQSYLAFDAPLAGAPSQDGVGINAVFQEYYLSPDWDVQAYSGGALPSAGAVQQLTSEEVDWVKVSTTDLDFFEVSTTNQSWTEIGRETINPDSINDGFSLITATRTDSFGQYRAQLDFIGGRDGVGGANVDDNTTYEVGATMLNVRAVADGNDIVYEVRGRNNQDWDWKMIIFFTERS